MKKLLLVALIAVFAITLFAVNYPTKSISLVCPWGAGGGTDRLARFMADDPEDFFEFVKTGFSQRRKKMKNNYETDIKPAMKRVGLSEAVRAEQVSLEKWLELYNEHKKTNTDELTKNNSGGETR